MKPTILTRTFALAGVALGALAIGSAANARGDVFFSAGAPAPGVYVQPAQVYTAPTPVYVHPRPTHVQPATVYVYPRPVYTHPAPVNVYPRPVYAHPAPVYVQPAPVYVQPQPLYRQPSNSSWDHDRGRYHDDHGWNPRGRWGDRDRDGIAHTHDPDHRHARRFAPWGDLDRDGLKNRDDADMDGDGVVNWHDRFPLDPYRR